MKDRACSRPRSRKASRFESAASIPAANASALSGSARRATVTARLVERRVGGRDDRRAARHRLDHRHAEALEPRGIDERLGSAVERRELLVVHVAERHDALSLQARALPARRAHDRQAKLRVAPAHERHRLQQRLEVLAPLERRDGEQVRAAEVPLRAVRPEDRVDRGMRDADPLARESEQLDDLARRELRVDDDQIARLRRLGVLARVHAVGLRVHPVREAEWEEVVDRRRTDASTLWRVHPVGEVEDVEGTRQPLDRTVAELAPAGPPPV